MDIYVSLNGNDLSSGGIGEPLRSLAAAKEKARELIASGISDVINVRVQRGEYSVSPMIFTELDSGKIGAPVRYIAEGEVILNGGVKIPSDSFLPVSEEVNAILSDEARDKVLVADIGKLGIRRDDYGEMCVIGSHNSGFLYDGAVTSPMWSELFVSGERMTIARYPNEGYLNIVGAVREGEGWESSTHAGIPHDDWVKMRNPISDIYKIDENTAKRCAGWKYGKDAWMFGYPRHDWADMSTPVVKIDANSCSMETKYVSMFGIILESERDDYHNGGKYYLYNILDELDAPGEWYLDRDEAKVYLYPKEDISDKEITLSLASAPIITFDGASDIEFFGFTVVGTRGDGIGGTVKRAVLDSVSVKHVAGHGLNIIGNDNTVKNCDISNTGRGGIYVFGGERETLTHGNNVVFNNYIHDFSKLYKTYQSGIQLDGCGNTAKNNEICNTPHQALYYRGNEHLIEYNYIHDCTYGSSDAGAIYAGRDWAAHGTVVRYNLIENIGGNGYFPDGIYWDDGLSGQTAYGNVLVGVEKFSLQLGGGHENSFCYNLIINSGKAALKFDDRYREAYFRKTGFTSVIEHSGASRTHWVMVEKMPFRSPLWSKKYPILARLKTDPDTDPNDPDYGINPSYCKVKYNAVVAPRGDLYRVFDGAYKYSEIDSNFVYDSLSLAKVDGKSYKIGEGSVIFTDIPDFPKIDVGKIGRRNEKN